MKTSFRFESLEVWSRSAAVTLDLLAFADHLESRKQFRFAEQLRGATLSITNNIAEGSGSSSNREFAQFINFARRSVFEVVNMLLIFEKHGLADRTQIEPWLAELEVISRMLESFRKKVGAGVKFMFVALGFLITALLNLNP